MTITASHPKAEYFSKYIYSNSKDEYIKGLDILLDYKCTEPSPEGYCCERCYQRTLYNLLGRNNSFIGLKKIFIYQLGLYEDPQIWLKEFRIWKKHSKLVSDYRFSELIDDVLTDILEVESQESDAQALFNVTHNNFSGATIQQVNLGGTNSQINNYSSVLERMKIDEVPVELIREADEILKDADKSGSMKKVAGNWIKNLPFKFIEKAGEWATRNPIKMSQYQDDLVNWFQSL